MEKYTIVYGYSHTNSNSYAVPVVCTEDQLKIIGKAICLGAQADWCFAEKDGRKLFTIAECM